jgi:hypothetical protein
MERMSSFIKGKINLSKDELRKVGVQLEKIKALMNII